MGVTMTRKLQPSLSESDQWILHIAGVIAAVRRNATDELSVTAAPFPTPGTMLSTAPYALDEWTTAGNGRYTHVTANTLTGIGVAAIGNSVRKQRAVADAKPQWRETITGQAWVTDKAVWWQNRHGHFQWPWASYTSMTLLAPGVLEIHGTSTKGPITSRYRTRLAELILVIWAAHQHPQHPQATNLGWAPLHLREAVAAITDV